MTNERRPRNSPPSDMRRGRHRTWIWHPGTGRNRTPPESAAAYGLAGDMLVPRRDEGWTVAEVIAALRWMDAAHQALAARGHGVPLLVRSGARCRAPRVVCIDDDGDFMLALRRRLERLGLVVASATDALRGYRAVLQEQPDLVIADYFMPAEHGTYLLRRLKEDAQLETLPVIVVTGRDFSARMGPRRDVTLEQHLRRLGAATVLTKPLNARLLSHAVRRCLTMSAGRRPCSTPEDHAG